MEYLRRCLLLGSKVLPVTDHDVYVTLSSTDIIQQASLALVAYLSTDTSLGGQTLLSRENSSHTVCLQGMIRLFLVYHKAV